MDKEQYNRAVKRMWRNNKRVRCCFICGLDDPSILRETEMHHIDGRANSNYVIDLCKNCHELVTREQNKLAPKDRSAKASRRKRRHMQIISHAALSMVMAEHDLETEFEMIYDDFDST